MNRRNFIRTVPATATPFLFSQNSQAQRTKSPEEIGKHSISLLGDFISGLVDYGKEGLCELAQSLIGTKNAVQGIVPLDEVEQVSDEASAMSNLYVPLQNLIGSLDEMLDLAIPSSHMNRVIGYVFTASKIGGLYISVSNVFENAIPLSRLKHKMEQTNELDYTDIPSDYYQDFILSLIVLCLELALIYSPVSLDYKLAWRGTRAVFNNCLYRIRLALDGVTQYSNTIYALSMSIFHWSLRQGFSVSLSGIQESDEAGEQLLDILDELQNEFNLFWKELRNDYSNRNEFEHPELIQPDLDVSELVVTLKNIPDLSVNTVNTLISTQK